MQDTGFHDLAEKALESEEEQTGEINKHRNLIR